MASSSFQRGRGLQVALFTAAALGACAWVVRRQVRRVEQAHPPPGRFVRVDGVQLHYTEHGADDAAGLPTLVLLHGNGTGGQEIRLSGLVEAAAPRYRVLVFDRPGFGHSTRPAGRAWTPEAQAELLHHALLKLGVRQPVVLAHSWATLVALQLGLRHPGSVGALVLVAGYYFPLPRLDVAFNAPLAWPLIGPLLRHTVSPLLGRLLWPAVLRRAFGPQPVPQPFRDGFPAWMALRPSQLQAAGAEAAMMIPGALRAARQYGGLAVPVVLVAGDDDLLVGTRRHTERLHGRIADSVLHRVPGAGHMVHHEAPEEVLAAIDQAQEMARGPAYSLRVEPTAGGLQPA